MADSGDSVSSWPGFVDQLNKTFMLVRDVFGYALPGGVFLAIGLTSGQFTLSRIQCLLLPYHVPVWMAFIGIVAASYAVGGVMASAGYMPFMVAKSVVWFLARHWLLIRHPLHALESAALYLKHQIRIMRGELPVNSKFKAPELKPLVPAAPESAPPPDDGFPTHWLYYHPTEVTSGILEIRLQNPKLVETLDRRETLAILAGSMTTALLGGWYVFYDVKWGFPQILKCAGLITLVQFITALGHLRRVAKYTYAADIKINAKQVAKSDPTLTQALVDLIKVGKTTADALLKKLGS